MRQEHAKRTSSWFETAQERLLTMRPMTTATAGRTRPMPIKYDALMALKNLGQKYAYTDREVMLYAVGIGTHADADGIEHHLAIGVGIFLAEVLQRHQRVVLDRHWSCSPGSRGCHRPHGEEALLRRLEPRRGTLRMFLSHPSRRARVRAPQDEVLHRRKERQRRAVGRLEHHFHLLADLQRVHVAVDEIGQQRRAFLQRDVADRVRPRRGFAHPAEGVDLALARAFLPHRLVGEAERTDRAREIMRLAQGGAALDQEFALRRGIPERLCLGIALRSRVFRFVGHHARSRLQVDAAWRTPRRPPVPCTSARSQFGTCTFGWACPRNCRTASMILVMPPRFTG